MAIIAMVSAKGSPGVTTTALACALSWDRPVLLAECDPAGGDLLAGYLGALEIPPMGLLQLAVAELRGTADDDFNKQIIDLDKRHPGRRLLLPGIADPVQAGTVRPTWPRLTEFFAGLERREPGHDVLADCGRLSSSATPWPLLHHADLVLLIVHAASLRTISPAMPTAAQLRRELTDHGRGPGSMGLLLIGSGPYKATDIQQRLQVPLFGELPHDPRTAAALSTGGRLRSNGALLRAAASAETPIRQAIDRRRAHLNTTVEARRG
jgi:hypothetical protein